MSSIRTPFGPFRVIHGVPKTWRHGNPQRLIRQMNGPTIVVVAPDRRVSIKEEVRLVAISTHGNEPSSIVAASQLFAYNPKAPDGATMVYFFVNPVSAQLNKRGLRFTGLPLQWGNANMIWNAAVTGNKSDLAGVHLFTQTALEALKRIIGDWQCRTLDFHNNSSSNPIYAVTSARESSLRFAGAFADIAIVFDEFLFSLIGAMEIFGPAASLETGALDDRRADHVACMLMDQFRQGIFNPRGIPPAALYRSIADVKLPLGTSLEIGPLNHPVNVGALRILGNISVQNFAPSVSRGPFARFHGDTLPLQVKTRSGGQELSLERFFVWDRTTGLVTAQPEFTLAMATTHTDNMFDCFFWLLESMTV